MLNKWLFWKINAQPPIADMGNLKTIPTIMINILRTPTSSLPATKIVIIFFSEIPSEKCGYNLANVSSSPCYTQVILKDITFCTRPFVDDISQKLQEVFKSHGFGTSFRPHTIQQKLPVAPKDPISIEERSGCVY